ncbi:hypothetical protein PUN28_004735 [Cardiocondyla obscurior]|uniref:Uncharacterized protein n=1 Tax=Cardiocondyla obscurior TaxID=286306 RepID=A0AAW2GHE3_9HYME
MRLGKKGPRSLSDLIIPSGIRPADIFLRFASFNVKILKITRGRWNSHKIDFVSRCLHFGCTRNFCDVKCPLMHFCRYVIT